MHQTRRQVRELPGRHIGYVISGGFRITHNDGTEVDLRAGDVYHIAPGHDAYNAGPDAVVVVEFQGAANFAKG